MVHQLAYTDSLVHTSSQAKLQLQGTGLGDQAAVEAFLPEMSVFPNAFQGMCCI